MGHGGYSFDGALNLVQAQVWGAKRPLTSGYVVSDAAGQAPTIDGFEIAFTPELEPVSVTDFSVQ